MLATEIREKLERGEPTIGSWLSMAHESIAEILADAGYDWVVIETEHTAIDVSEVLRLVMAIQGQGSIPLVRLAWNDPIQTKAVLDSGAAGVLVPNVNSADQARQAVDAVKYPPDGKRGVGLARAQGYGERFDDYVEDANDGTLLFVQIEHVDAVDAIEDIVAVPGIDGTFIGPYDLSMSMGIPGQLDHPDVQAAQEHVREATLEAGLAPGIHLVHPDRAAHRLQEHLDKGYRFIALGTDILFLGDSARRLHDDANNVLTKHEEG